MPPSAQIEFLKRRNALWQQLRDLPPGSEAFETVMRDLSSLTGWSRERVLAGLGLTPEDVTALPRQR